VVVKLKALEVDAQHVGQRLDGCALHCRNALAQLLTKVRVVTLHELTLQIDGSQRNDHLIKSWIDDSISVFLRFPLQNKTHHRSLSACPLIEVHIVTLHHLTLPSSSFLVRTSMPQTLTNPEPSSAPTNNPRNSQQF
jgi:hypothetical protein